jgi:RNA polymerase sigma factor (sigma-70 family)
VLGVSDGADDVAQETALQALLGLHTLRDPDQFGSWLAGIGLNLARRAIRARAHDAWSWEALAGGRLVREPIERDPGPEHLLEINELSVRVRASVADLPHGQRSAVLLVYLSGLSYRETAAALGIEVGTVKTRLHKGRHNLQRSLRDLWMEDVMTTEVKQQFIEMRVADVRRREADGDKPPRSLVLLEEVGGARQMSIWTGNFEGEAIALRLEKVQVARPLTHSFTANLLRAGGISMREVRISRLAEETFYAQAVMDGDTGEKVVDARPSDALALALELGVRIYVAPDVLNAAEAGRSARAAEPEVPTIGAAAIVDAIIERWPAGQTPTR